MTLELAQRDILRAKDYFINKVAFSAGPMEINQQILGQKQSQDRTQAGTLTFTQYGNATPANAWLTRILVL